MRGLSWPMKYCALWCCDAQVTRWAGEAWHARHPVPAEYNDTHHLKCLMWAVYDGALLVGRRPELPRNCQWCTVLVGLYKHIYWGCDDVAHCLPYTLASWDCQEKTEALH